ncbi:MAG: translation initiation factor [Wendovervirus sonii]|uniref:Translation initiation factor n=1 Tax=phage Lak_Megaphage_Sonny TaxID=3109229 RepID=A0ABZ0Z2Y3_9CAUD|nr:MAG: translation initiation factor [phage Lak_Megaphage_Sonny]
MQKVKDQKTNKLNNEIRVPNVRVIYDEENVVMPTYKALQLAESRGEDLIMISENANPPVCKIMEYGKFLYQQKKKEKEMKSKQTVMEIKEIHFGPNEGEHDYQFKMKHAIEFLQAGKKVKAQVFFKGRSIDYADQGKLILLRLAQDLEEYGKIEKLPELIGKNMIMTINPKK